MDCDSNSDEVNDVVCVTVAMSGICSSKYKGVCPFKQRQELTVDFSCACFTYLKWILYYLT